MLTRSFGRHIPSLLLHFFNVPTRGQSLRVNPKYLDIFPSLPLSVSRLAWSMELLWFGSRINQAHSGDSVSSVSPNQGPAFLSLLKHWSQIHFLFGFPRAAVCKWSRINGRFCAKGNRPFAERSGSAEDSPRLTPCKSLGAWEWANWPCV